MPLALLTGCLALDVVPEREQKVITWGPGGTTATLAMSRETGAQLFWGERHDAVGERAVGSDVSKQVMGAVALGLGGALAGGMAGGGIGALAGGAGGAALGDYLTDSGDAPTTGTAAGVAGLLGSGVRSSATGQQAAAPNVLADWLAAYVEANPQACGLAQRIGGQQAGAVIRQLGANPALAGALLPIMQEIVAARGAAK